MQDHSIANCMETLAALAPSQDRFWVKHACSRTQLHAYARIYMHDHACRYTRTCPRMQDVARGLPRDQWCMRVEAKPRHACTILSTHARANCCCPIAQALSTPATNSSTNTTPSTATPPPPKPAVMPKPWFPPPPPPAVTSTTCSQTNAANVKKSGALSKLHPAVPKAIRLISACMHPWKHSSK